MKVSELIEWLKTLEQDWEICRKTGYGPFEDISHVDADDELKTYSLS